MKTKLWVLLLCIALLSLTGCDNGATMQAKEPVALPRGIATVPAINSTLKLDGKTLYEYYSANEDTIGWLTIDGIDTDNVVMLGQKGKRYAKGSDGENHYLDFDFNHTARTAGELYIDQRCRISYDSMSQNMTVYGHHMKDGSMLTGLDYYKRESYYKEHQYMTFHTLWGTYHFRVFAVFTVNLKVPSDAKFNYRKAEYGDGFNAFINEVKRRSYYDTGIEVTAEDRILTLSTCTYPTGNPARDNARLVVMGRRCTPEEEAALAKTA